MTKPPPFIYISLHTHPSDLRDAGASEGHYDSHNVDSELELEKLGNAVVDVPAPHHCLDNAAEVVIGQNDIRRLLGHVRAGNALDKHRQGAVRVKSSFICHSHGVWLSHSARHCIMPST